MSRIDAGPWPRQTSYSPWLTQRLGSQTVGLLVGDKFVFLQIVMKLTSQEDGDVRGMASDVRITGGVGVALGQAARLHAIEKVANVERRRVAADFCDRPSRDQFGRAQHELAAVA